MTTPPGWAPRSGPQRDDPARPARRGPGDWTRDGADSRRQGPRGDAAPQGGGAKPSPSFTPSRGSSGPRGNGSSSQRDLRKPADDFDRTPRRGGPVLPANTGRPANPVGQVRMDRLFKDSGGAASGPQTMRFGGSVWQAGALTRWLGRLSTPKATAVLLAGTALGAVASIALGQEPGDVLGFFVILGSVAAAFGIIRGKAHLLFPMPALASAVAAVVVGKIHDAKLGSSTASLATGLTQWLAAIFLPAVAATILVLVIGGTRWVLGRQAVPGQSLVSPGGPARRSPPMGTPRMAQASRSPAPSARRLARDDFDRIDDLKRGASPEREREDSARDDPDRDDWMDEKPFEDQPFKTEMIPAVKDGPAKQDRPPKTSVLGGSQPPASPPRDRDQRNDRDPWGEPRSRPDRAQAPRPGPHPSAQPRQGGAPRPSFKPNQPGQRNPNPNPNPRDPSQRPQRRQPPEGWNAG